MLYFRARHRVRVWSRGPGITPAAILFPAYGKHLSHQCRGDWEEASLLIRGSEITSFYPAATCRNGLGAAHRTSGRHCDGLRSINHRSPSGQRPWSAGILRLSTDGFPVIRVAGKVGTRSAGL